ncbi:probable E3 ubiquitin ligase SUD1 [Lolium rigidum]|uniref:probable E3 ubiquitin ligase SUD1 n=1 Tax=Lolium rigidum TaxID=89674 RepID=UPI001F5D4F33|nr:probable E3 ubiquitin ligase SUD1 [Lolium rigidum]
MAAAAAAPPETPLPSADDPAYAEEEEQCRICRFPAEADRPLRRPCACRGSIQFVHDECQLQWMAIRHQHECEVCKRLILTRPVYAADAPARLPLWEFMLGAPNRIMGLLLSLFFAACVLRESVVRLTTLWSWRVAVARTFAQVHRLLSLGLSTTSIITLIPLWVLFAQKLRPSAVAPFTRWVQRMEARLHGLRGFDGLQVVALFAVEGLLWVLIGDMALACVFGFLPFSLGRITLWCMSCFNFGIVDELDSYTSTASVLLIGYGFIFSAGATFAGLNTFRRYLTGKRLMIASFFTSPCDTVLRGIVYLITLANICLNLLNPLILQPLLLGWLLDICTSKMFGATISERFKLLIAPSFASNALHWLIGLTIPTLRHKLSKIVHQFLIGNMVLYLEWVVGRVTMYSFFTAGEDLGNNAAPKVQYGSSDEVNDKRRFFVVGTMSRVLLAWLAVVIFIVPLLIGMLVDLSLLSPFIGPDDDVPVVGFFCTWFLGRQLQNIGNYLAPRTRFSPYLPFVAYFIDEGHYGNVCLSREVLTSVKLTRLLQDELLPIASKLVAALGVPYVLAKCIFPILGYPVAVNLVVYRFAWLGSLTFCVLCIKLHASIRNDRYAIGRRLEDVDDTCWKTQLLGLYFE